MWGCHHEGLQDDEAGLLERSVSKESYLLQTLADGVAVHVRKPKDFLY